VKQDELFQYLIEAKVEDPNVQAYFDRLMLRLFESPPLLASFVNATSFKDGKDVVIQLEFHKVPTDFHTDLTKLAGARDVQVVNYEKDGLQYTGLQVRLTSDDVMSKKEREARQLARPFQPQQFQMFQPQVAGSSAASTGLR
jgi:hypothetical protein